MGGLRWRRGSRFASGRLVRGCRVVGDVGWRAAGACMDRTLRCLKEGQNATTSRFNGYLTTRLGAAHHDSTAIQYRDRICHLVTPMVTTTFSKSPL
jgi:hypothetical protein